MHRLREAAFCAIAVAVFCLTPPSATPSPADQSITVKHVLIEGADSLSHSQIEEVKSAVMGKPEPAQVLMDTARERLTMLLSNNCYIQPDSVGGCECDN